MSESEPPLSVAGLIAQARVDAESQDPLSAIAHALIAIAEQGEPLDDVAEAEPDGPTPRMWTNDFRPTTDPDTVHYVTVDQREGGPAGRRMFVRHHSEYALFMPGKHDLMAANAAITSMIWQIQRGQLDPTSEVINEIARCVVLAMRWRPSSTASPPLRTVAIAFNTGTGRPIAVYGDPQAAHAATAEQRDVGFSEWPVL